MASRGRASSAAHRRHSTAPGHAAAGAGARQHQVGERGDHATPPTPRQPVPAGPASGAGRARRSVDGRAGLRAGRRAPLPGSGSWPAHQGHPGAAGELPDGAAGADQRLPGRAPPRSRSAGSGSPAVGHLGQPPAVDADRVGHDPVLPRVAGQHEQRAAVPPGDVDDLRQRRARSPGGRAAPRCRPRRGPPSRRRAPGRSGPSTTTRGADAVGREPQHLRPAQPRQGRGASTACGGAAGRHAHDRVPSRTTQTSARVAATRRRAERAPRSSTVASSPPYGPASRVAPAAVRPDARPGRTARRCAASADTAALGEPVGARSRPARARARRRSTVRSAPPLDVVARPPPRGTASGSKAAQSSTVCCAGHAVEVDRLAVDPHLHGRGSGVAAASASRPAARRSRASSGAGSVGAARSGRRSADLPVDGDRRCAAATPASGLRTARPARAADGPSSSRCTSAVGCASPRDEVARVGDHALPGRVEEVGRRARRRAARSPARG